MKKTTGFTLISLLRFHRRSCQGFTLIELLVSVSIIIVLTTLGLISYSEIQKKGRDARRQTDLKVIQSALEQYRADQGYYPISVAPGGVISEGAVTYLAEVPKDPNENNNFNYCYQGFSTSGGTCDNTTTKCVKYGLYANLDQPISSLLYRNNLAKAEAGLRKTIVDVLSGKIVYANGFLALTPAKAICETNQVKLEWAPYTEVGKTIYYLLRVNDQSTFAPSGDWNALDGSDSYIDDLATNSFTRNIKLGQQYNWWVHAAYDPVNYGDKVVHDTYTDGGNFTCNAAIAPIFGGSKTFLLGGSVCDPSYICNGKTYCYQVTPP